MNFNLQFYFVSNVIMISRLIFMFNENSITRKQWLFMILIQLTGFSFFQFNCSLGITSLVFLLIDIVFLFESKINKLEIVRTSILIIQLIILSIVFSSEIGLDFNSGANSIFQNIQNYSLLLSGIKLSLWMKINIILFGLLIVLNEINIFIRFLLKQINVLPFGEKKDTNVIDIKNINTIEFNAGKLIGLLERFLMYLFILSGNSTLIGFILAAKGFTRFKELDKKEFAEYVLVGTLLSTLLAVLIGSTIQSLLN
jgi:hypothetical protein